MVPGITDTECRIAAFRYRERHAEADRLRRAASAAPVPTGQVRGIETMQRHIGAAMERVSHLYRTKEATAPAPAAGTLAVH